LEKDTRLKSLLKGVSWRIIATATTITIAYFITGDVSSAMSIGFIEFFGKLLLYYVHERAWQFAPSFRRKNKKLDNA